MRTACEHPARGCSETRPSHDAYTILTVPGYVPVEMFTRRQQRRRHAIDAWVRIEMEERLAAEGRPLPPDGADGAPGDVIALPAAGTRRRSENDAGDEPAARSL